MNDYFKDICDWRDDKIVSPSVGSISHALKQIREAYYRRTAKHLQELVLSQEVYQALQRELYHEFNLDELPNDIKLYGMTVRQETK